VQTSSRPITQIAFACCFKSLTLFERLQDGQLSTRQTPAQVTCAHCQRSWEPASAPDSVLATEVPEGAAHYTAVFVNVNTCPRIFLLPPEPSEPPSFEASVQPGRASYSIVSFRQPPVETVIPYRAPFDLTIRRPGRASYSFVSVRQHSPKPPSSAPRQTITPPAGPRILQHVFDSSTRLETAAFCASRRPNKASLGAAHYGEMNGAWEGGRRGSKQVFFGDPFR
jgi:hypothetical protein